jgi:beta-glucosidase
MISLNNGWTYVWQGSEPSLYPKEKPTIQRAIEEKIGTANFRFVPGTRIVRKPNSTSNNNPTNIDEEVDVAGAVAAAKDSDVVVLCLGEGSYTEHPGSVADLTLSEIQLRFAEQIIAAGKPVILVLTEGRPRIISRIADKVTAIVLAMNPGNEGGRAVSDVLFGDYNPNGRLPFTYPRSPGYLTTYDANVFPNVMLGDKRKEFEPQFEFGFGLSYANFQYSDLGVTPVNGNKDGSIDVSVNVTNNGQRIGKETVILYVRDEVAMLTPAAKRVRRFAKVDLLPGETKNVSFTLRPEDLGFIATDNKFVVEPGDFTAMVGGLSAKFTLR